MFLKLSHPICKRGMTDDGLVVGSFLSFVQGFMTIPTTRFV